ncbi:hypothetical protein Lal_00035235 [Lupinus albus]|nr:hypothetical protein Lal_00035235 [Lupinus albus]
MVQHTWLESIYQELREDADEELVEKHNDRRIPYVGYIRVLSPPDRHSTTLGISCIDLSIPRTLLCSCIRIKKKLEDSYYYFSNGHTTTSQFSLQGCTTTH